MEIIFRVWYSLLMNNQTKIEKVAFHIEAELKAANAYRALALKIITWEQYLLICDELEQAQELMAS